MGNVNIEPFGQTAEVPAGYPITSSLDVNDAQMGASAAAAYELKRMIMGASVNVEPNELAKETLYIDSSNARWLINYAQQNDLRSVSYPLDGVEKIRITCNGSHFVRFAIVTDATPTDLGSIDFATGESLRTVLSGQSEEFEIPSDADRVVFNWYDDFVDNPFGFVAIKQESVVAEMIDEGLAGIAEFNNRIIVAASNTPEELAAKADIKCTGSNDEVALNLAIDNAISNGFGVLLLRGDYYLDAPTKKYSSNNDTFLLIDTSPASGSSVSRSFCMEGESPAVRPTVHMSDTAYETLGSSTQYHFVGITDSTQYGGFVELKNIIFQLPSNQKKVVVLDFLNYGGYARIHSVYCYGYTNGYNGQQITISNPPAVAVEGCVGIKFVGKGPNGSYGSEITDCNIYGFNEGICINTEWTVCNHVCSIFCVTGWVFGKYTSSNIHAQCHPVVLICCGDERGVNLPVFYNSQNGLQNIDMIAFSIERNANNTPGGVLGNYATERVQGSSRGRIDYTQGQASNSTTARFWEYGHGHNMTTRNMAHAASGSTSVRNGYAPNYMQRFYDETLGKEVICVNEQNKTWKDGAGNVV